MDRSLARRPVKDPSSVPQSFHTLLELMTKPSAPERLTLTQFRTILTDLNPVQAMAAGAAPPSLAPSAAHVGTAAGAGAGSAGNASAPATAGPGTASRDPPPPPGVSGTVVGAAGSRASSPGTLAVPTADASGSSSLPTFKFAAESRRDAHGVLHVLSGSAIIILPPKDVYPEDYTLYFTDPFAETASAGPQSSCKFPVPQVGFVGTVRGQYRVRSNTLGPRTVDVAPVTIAVDAAASMPPAVAAPAAVAPPHLVSPVVVSSFLKAELVGGREVRIPSNDSLFLQPSGEESSDSGTRYEYAFILASEGPGTTSVGGTCGDPWSVVSHDAHRPSRGAVVLPRPGQYTLRVRSRLGTFASELQSFAVVIVGKECSMCLTGLPYA